MVSRSAPTGFPLPRTRGFHVVIGPTTRRRRIGGWIGLAIALSAMFLLLVSSRIALDRAAFVLEDYEVRIAAEEARYWELRLQVTELQSAERIATIAAEMGMVYPDRIFTIEVPGLGGPGPGIEDRWIDLKALLSASAVP
jgi:cell division protein FtsL